jgi:hypothetical protein
MSRFARDVAGRRHGPIEGEWRERDERNTCDTCAKSVRRAYSELRAKGIGDIHAFEAASVVYRFHHPDARDRDVLFAASECLDEPELTRDRLH